MSFQGCNKTLTIPNKVVKPSLQVGSPPVEADSEKSGLLEPEIDGSKVVWFFYHLFTS